MSQENVETIARLYDEFLAKPERLAAPSSLPFFDPAVEVHLSDLLLGTKGTFHGYDGLGYAAREIFEAFSESQFVLGGIPFDLRVGVGLLPTPAAPAPTPARSSPSNRRR